MSDGRDPVGQRRWRCSECRSGVCGELRSQHLNEGIALGTTFGISDVQRCEFGAQVLLARQSRVTLAPERIEALGQLAHQLNAGLIA